MQLWIPVFWLCCTRCRHNHSNSTRGVPVVGEVSDASDVSCPLTQPLSVLCLHSHHTCSVGLLRRVAISATVALVRSPEKQVCALHITLRACAETCLVLH